MSTKLVVSKTLLLRTNFNWHRNLRNIIKRSKYSYSFSPGDHPLTHLTLGETLNEAADVAGDDISIISRGQNVKLTFLKLKNDADKLASGFISLGLCKGDRIAICAPNVYEWPITLYAAAKAGLILVNINPAYRAHELEYALNKAGCKALVTSETFKTTEYYKMLCSLIPELPQSKSIDIQSKRIPSLKNIIMLSEKAKNGTLTFNDLLNAGDSESQKRLNSIEKSVQFDDAVNIQFTSGTTGNPKGATLSHHSLLNNALIANNRLVDPHVQKQIICCPIPLYHSYACVLGLISSILGQDSLVLPSAGFDPLAVLDSIGKEKCTRILGAPTMYVDIVNKYDPKKHTLTTLRQAVIGGASTPEQVFRDLQEKLGISYIHEGYGTTEASPSIATSGGIKDYIFSQIITSYMEAIEFTEIKIVDQNGYLVPIGETGEICIRGHHVFLGYWEDKSKTDEVLTKTRWYHTGDIGKMNEAGRVKVVGRIKDLVIRGGENIYPVEVENFLHQHPAISEVHICGVPDPKMGEELCAWVMIKQEEKLTEEDIKSFCKEKISHFKIPRYIIFVDSFPKVMSGKVQKFVMKEKSIKILGL